MRTRDRLAGAWDWLMHFLGFDRIKRSEREFALEERGRWGRRFYFLRPLIAFLLIAYLVMLGYRFSWLRGADMTLPQQVIVASGLSETGAETQPESGEAQIKSCAPSQTVAMQVALLDMLVNENDWAPGSPIYRFGFFGVLPFADTPFFDNKASFQLGALSAARRMAIELTDTLGRVRGTTSADLDLQGALSKLRVNERAWVINNPFDQQLNTISVSAGASYDGAIDLYRRFNDRLARCDALFDLRADNLLTVVDRIAKDVGSTANELAERSAGLRYDARLDEFVDGDGNDLGWFDMHADNFFHNARGQMYAYHVLLQALREDFLEIIEQRNLGSLWDLMEQHVAEAAVLNPLIVSNGREDGLVMPDHLSVMAANMLRARANMVELRGVLDR